MTRKKYLNGAQMVEWYSKQALVETKLMKAGTNR